MLYLHIGSEKTGSSSIQWLLRKKGFAAATGVERLKGGSDWGQPMFVHALHPQSQRHDDVMATLNAMADRVNAEPERSYVLSNEVLFRKNVAASLARGLGSRVSVPVKVICYLRRPDAYLESSYKQRVKNARIEPGVDAYRASGRDSLDFDGILGEYAQEFGAENIIVRLYERDRFPEGNVVLDFLSLIGVKTLPEGVETAFERNRSLSAVASELVGQVARIDRDMHSAALNHMNGADNKGLRRSRDVFTLAERRAIMEECAPNLERVRQAYLGDETAMFDQSDLGEDVRDPYPDAEERVALTRAAAEEMIRFLSNAARAASRSDEDEATRKGRRAERLQRRALRRAALATDGAPAPQAAAPAADENRPKQRRAQAAEEPQATPAKASAPRRTRRASPAQA